MSLGRQIAGPILTGLAQELSHDPMARSPTAAGGEGQEGGVYLSLVYPTTQEMSRNARSPIVVSTVCVCVGGSPTNHSRLLSETCSWIGTESVLLLSGLQGQLSHDDHVRGGSSLNSSRVAAQPKGLYLAFGGDRILFRQGCGPRRVPQCQPWPDLTSLTSLLTSFCFSSLSPPPSCSS